MKARLAIISALLLVSSNVFAQDVLPKDNFGSSYFPSPNWRESEAHPLRTAAYVVHPVGWLLREGFYRPLSAFMASNIVTKSVFGYRDPYDFRETICFNPSIDVPDCAMIPPYSKIDYSSNNLNTFVDSHVSSVNNSYNNLSHLSPQALVQLQANKQVYFPDIAFEFGKSKLNALGEGRVRQVALLLKADPSLNVVLEGNTDNRGNDKANVTLGEKRSQTVKRELIALGIDASRLGVTSNGKNIPVFTDNTEWAHAVNRRVVISVGGNQDAVNVKTPDQVAKADFAQGSVAAPTLAQDEAKAPAQVLPPSVKDSVVETEIKDDTLPAPAL
ncbi:MAG: OmpA family protein [Deltaproteobacteria bacterium]|jgi:outer membrane protein OmpA-like peptidoglycan-associated protein|nr:OmpA family protein [Deltaproteobacteria bacterium]